MNETVLHLSGCSSYNKCFIITKITEKCKGREIQKATPTGTIKPIKGICLLCYFSMESLLLSVILKIFFLFKKCRHHLFKIIVPQKAPSIPIGGREVAKC